MTITAATRHLTASAAVFDSSRRLVLLVHHILTGQAQLPGGHVDPDEAPHDCALREVFEETGVAAALHAPGRVDLGYGRWLPAPVQAAEFPAPADPAWGEPAHRHIDLLYVATADSAAPITAQLAEVHGAVWEPVDTIGAAAVRADVPAVVPAAWAYLTGETL
jgi:8-oxo-dGTP pyrophosphatase MutT (NUDIX family)